MANTNMITANNIAEQLVASNKLSLGYTVAEFQLLPDYKNIISKMLFISSATLSLKVGDTKQLTATIGLETKTATGVTWKSSDTSIATVTSTGLVKAVKEGAATITATKDGKTATCTVTVNNTATGAVEKVTIDMPTLSLRKGRTRQLTAFVTPDNATNKQVKWKSSDTSIATVDQNGKVTAGKSRFIDAGRVLGTLATMEEKVTKYGIVAANLQKEFSVINQSMLTFKVKESADVPVADTPKPEVANSPQYQYLEMEPPSRIQISPQLKEKEV